MRLPWGLRWWELAPEAALGVVLAVFSATETSAATSALGSRTAVGLMAGTAAAWFAVRVALVRFAPWPALRLGVFAAAAAGVAAVVVLPAYDDTTVVETLTAPPATTAAPRTTSAEGAGGPVALRRSTLQGIDHRAAGTAVVYRQPDGSFVVGLEDIDIQPGPDYDLYVVPGAGRQDRHGGAALGDLRGNKGTQYYPVPAGVEVGSGAWTVLVWCETFDVPIANASPA